VTFPVRHEGDRLFWSSLIGGYPSIAAMLRDQLLLLLRLLLLLCGRNFCDILLLRLMILRGQLLGILGLGGHLIHLWLRELSEMHFWDHPWGHHHVGHGHPHFIRATIAINLTS
jgi:hypothetical protein